MYAFHKLGLGKSLIALSLASLLAACNGGDNNSNTSDTATAQLDLKIIHINDHHSHLEASDVDLMLGGAETNVDMGGFPRVVSQFKELSSGDGHVLKLHAGDAITGDLYYTLFDGRADADLMNEVCFDAFALGNHEFDAGDEGLVTFLDFLNGSGNCTTPVLAANVVPEVGVSPLAQSSATDYIQPYTIKTYGDVKVAIIGIDIANKTKNSSNPDETTQFLDEATTAQNVIDDLKNNEGVDHIILLTHYQYENDKTLAANLTDVDVIVGGDSHTLLGEKFNDLGLNAKGAYPTEVTNKDGDKTCIVQAWEFAQIVGELNVSFEGGKVTSCTGTPHLLIGDNFSREDPATEEDVNLTGADLDAVMADVNAIAELSIVTPDAAAQTKLDTFSAETDVLKATKIGEASDDLCLERIPGQGRSTICDVADTASNGGDIQMLVAWGFREMSNTSDISIQNAGGVREDIPAGDITIGDAYTLLPFSNTLVEFTMTGAEIKQVLEEAITFANDPDGSTGAYPYAAGLRWNVDMTQPEGSRLSNLEVKSKTATEWSALDETASYIVVTNNFIAGGRDGYLTFATVADDGRMVDTYLDYAQSFANYVEAEGTVGKLPIEEYSTQQYINADGVMQ